MDINDHILYLRFELEHFDNPALKKDIGVLPAYIKVELQSICPFSLSLLEEIGQVLVNGN